MKRFPKYLGAIFAVSVVYLLYLMNHPYVAVRTIDTLSFQMQDNNAPVIIPEKLVLEGKLLPERNLAEKDVIVPQKDLPVPEKEANKPWYSTSTDALVRLGNLIKRGFNQTDKCQALEFGQGWGGHRLCTLPPPKKPCLFYSFGISSDYSFDTDVAERLGCSGIAADPTIAHSSVIHPKVTFHHVGAKSLDDKINEQWMLVTSVPGLRKWLKHDTVAVVKMDCEGCEYSLARDIIEEDPEFFHHVDQFHVEVHLPKMWMKASEHFYSFANMIRLLEEANLELIHAALTPCAPYHEAFGIVDELVAAGYPCDKGAMCHNYLFARLKH